MSPVIFYLDHNLGFIIGLIWLDGKMDFLGITCCTGTSFYRVTLNALFSAYIIPGGALSDPESISARNDKTVGDSLKLLCLDICKASFFYCHSDLPDRTMNGKYAQTLVGRVEGRNPTNDPILKIIGNLFCIRGQLSIEPCLCLNISPYRASFLYSTYSSPFSGPNLFMIL